jgi:hypothetical protein
MKKALICLAVLVMAAGLFGASVTVTSPAAGATWLKGQSCSINWTKSGDMPGEVRILLRDSASTTNVLVIADPAPNSGHYGWVVPADVPDGQYRIRVKVKTVSIFDDSDVFTIGSAAPPPAASITVTKPAANDTWNKSSSHNITWTKTGSMPNLVKISLMDKNSAAVVGEIADNVPNSGSYSWTIPGDTAAGQYRVRVAVKTTDIKDDSATFEVKSLMTKQPAQKAYVASKVALKHLAYDEYTKNGVYLNWSNVRRTNVSPPVPPVCWQGLPTGYPQGAGSNQYAQVGYNYRYCQSGQFSWWFTFCYRSRVAFPLQEFQGQAAKLILAKMKVHRVTNMAIGDVSIPGATGLSVFKAPWTDWYSTPVQDPMGLPFNSADYSLDITDIVRKWLDGSVANNGLLLISQEVYWGQVAKASVCTYEISLELRFSRD